MKNLGNDLNLFLENISGLMVIDRDEKVRYINEQCADYLKVNRINSLGKPAKEVFPLTIMPKMLKGKSKYNTTFYFYEGRMSVSSQVQLRKNGEVVGVLEYDMIQDVEGLDDFLDKYGQSLKEEMNYFQKQVRDFKRTKYSIGNIVGSSKKIQDLKKQIEIAATTSSTVLIHGETGTGKELVAHSIHNLSKRAFNEFVKINSAGLPYNLFESELFGYEEGSFTGAKKGGKKGKFQLADQGTLFIDEIHQMPLGLQPKLLRALQEGDIDPIGSECSIPVDVRVIAATNESLWDMVKEGTFREDLYYRLNVFQIEIPPLRERLEDLPELVEAKIANLNVPLGKSIKKVSPKVYEKFFEHDWPGNVRELNNKIESAMNYADGDTLNLDHFNRFRDSEGTNLDVMISHKNPIEEVKRQAEGKLINEVLIKFGGNKTRAAEYLKISRPLLYQKIKRLGIKG